MRCFIQDLSLNLHLILDPFSAVVQTQLKLQLNLNVKRPVDSIEDIVFRYNVNHVS